MKKYTDMVGVRKIFENVRQVNKENEDTQWNYPIKFGMQLIIGYLNEGDDDFQQTMDFISEYHDVMAEILTCSAFLIHQPLLERWRDEEGQYIEYINGVNFSTKWNTPMDRLERLERCEELFKNDNSIVHLKDIKEKLILSVDSDTDYTPDNFKNFTSNIEQVLIGKAHNFKTLWPKLSKDLYGKN